MSLKTEHTTEQNRMDEKWMRHLSAVLIPKIMHVFAFGILIFLLVQSHGVRQSSAAPKDTRQKTKSKWNETFYISKSITIKYIKLLNVARSRERKREEQRDRLIRKHCRTVQCVARTSSNGSKYFYETRNEQSRVEWNSQMGFLKEAAGWSWFVC